MTNFENNLSDESNHPVPQGLEEILLQFALLEGKTTDAIMTDALVQYCTSAAEPDLN